jgi:hypothetical protein
MNLVNGNSAPGIAFHFSAVRTREISSVVTHIDIIDNRGMSIKTTVSVSGYMIVVYRPVGDITLRYKDPSSQRYVDVDIDVEARAQWCPSVVAASGSPVHPCRTPFRTRHPDPSIIIVKEPASVVKRRPTPVVVRNPGVAIVSNYPVPPCAIGLKSFLYIGDPYTAVILIVDPLSVW